MGWPKNVVLVRHAESEGNVLTVEERANLPVATHEYAITERGRRQAECTGGFLERLETHIGAFDVRYTSYYRRAKETMEVIQPGMKCYEDARLAEANRGIWHTMTHDEIRAQFPREFDRKEREGLYHYRPFGGENWPDIELRIHSFLGTLARDCEDLNVLIVVHGHWLILFEKLIQHFSKEEAVRRYREAIVENASVTIYSRILDEKGRERLHFLEPSIVPWDGAL